MVSSWLSLFLGVAILQGTFSASPIPELTLEDEWAEFNQLIRNPAYRLPTTTRPRHYEVSLTPYLDFVPSVGIRPFSFDGSVRILLSPTEIDVNEIVLHCNDLNIQSVSLTYMSGSTTVLMLAPNQDFFCDEYSFLRIRSSDYLRMNQEYELRLTFQGNLQTNMRGFYRSWYRDGSGDVRWMATTQFQPGHARQAFPCYDEPGFKATFDISINRLATFSPTISNMPIRSTSTVVDGRLTETFYTTPLTSTYLLAIIVSHYIPVSSNGDTARPFTIYARNNIGNDGDYALDVGERLLVAMEEYTQIPYYTMAPNMDMKQAAIPDFSAGAMENWGLLTYREARLLYNPENTNHQNYQRIANIVSHEIAHMWFGNLVTCAWWDNLWLNEAFARFYQYFLTAQVEPEFGYETRFIVEQVQVSMVSDSIDSAHPLTDPRVTDPTSVSAHFSTITYARGASVLRMTQYLLGVDTYIRGLRNYLRDRRYDVAEPHHLFDALDAAAAEDGALDAYNGITISEYFRTWSEKAGHPLLSVSIDQRTGRMSVTQSRWERNTGVSSDPSLWHIPITWTRQGAIDFEDLKPSSILSDQVSILERGTTGLEWVIFNKQETGFYRVNYDDTNWALLTRALRSNERTAIHEYNRAQIVDDLFVFARAGVLPYNRVFNILSFLAFEDQYAPWIAAITGYTFALRRLAHSPAATQSLRDQIIENSAAVVNRLGFAEPANEAFMTSLLRLNVNTFLCNVGHPQCISAAVQNFQAWRNGVAIPPNMRPWVYCAGLRAGTVEDFNFFWNRYLIEDHASEQVVMLESAGCTQHAESLAVYWEAITNLETELIRPQDSSTAISAAITGNEDNTLRSFEWVTNNIERTRNSIGLNTPLNSIISRVLNDADYQVVSNWVEANRELLGDSAYNTCISALATARTNLDWYQRRVPEFNAYFETGYQEDVIEEITEGGEEEVDTTEAPEIGVTEAPEEENPGDSANIAVLSFVTLFVTLAINFSL